MTASVFPSADVPIEGTYRIDPHRSKVGYSGRHMFGAGVVHATFTIRSGAVSVMDPPESSTVSAVLDAASFHSNSAKRDKDVRAASLLDVATYPDISFVSTALSEDSDCWRLAGVVTAHGESAPVEMVIDRVQREADGTRLHARASHLDRYAFGVTKGKGMVGRYLDLDFDLFLAPA